MAEHIPYEEREREVLYIMDEPPKPTNGLGLAGFILSIIALLTGGFLSPLSLLLSFLGLFKRPKRWALWGTFLSLIGVTFIGSMMLFSYQETQRHRNWFEQQHNRLQAAAVIDQATQSINSMAQVNQRLPEGIEGNKITIKYRDPWGSELRYDYIDKGHFVVRSAGPDGRFESLDDIVSRGTRQYSPGESADSVGLIPTEAEGEFGSRYGQAYGRGSSAYSSNESVEAEVAADPED